MTVKSFKLKPKMKEDKILERIDISVEFSNEGQDIKEKYLIMYNGSPDQYRIYPIRGGDELAKGEINNVLKYYIARFIKEKIGEYEDMTLIPVLSSGLICGYEQI